jgi:hypothetical protein
MIKSDSKLFENMNCIDYSLLISKIRKADLEESRAEKRTEIMSLQFDVEQN